MVVRDVTGLTGLKIIDDICIGNLDPKSLAAHRHHNCKKSEEEIAKALVSNQRADYLFGLKQEYDRYQFYSAKILKYVQEIGKLLDTTIRHKEQVIDHIPDTKYLKRQNKNASKELISILFPISISMALTYAPFLELVTHQF